MYSSTLMSSSVIYTGAYNIVELDGWESNDLGLTFNNTVNVIFSSRMIIHLLLTLTDIWMTFVDLNN